MDDARTLNITVGFGAIILLILMVQAVLPERIPEAAPPEPEEECIGEPIVVDYAFVGGVVEPWACQEQCEDDRPRYVLYTNGIATQCETPPGCNDWGEDHGVTCEVPAPVTPVSGPAGS